MKPDNDHDFQHDLRQLDRPGPDPAFVEDLRRRLHAAHTRRHAPTRRWAFRLLPWTAGGAVAAAVLLLATLWLSSDMGFAGVQESLRQVTTARFEARLVVDRAAGWPEDMLLVTAWLDVNEGARTRADLLGRPVLESITHWDEQVWVINHLRGRATSWAHGRNVDRWVRELDPATLIQQLRDRPGIVAREREPEVLAGKRARRFQLTGRALDLQPGAAVELWVDAQTNLPMRIEFALPPVPQGSLRLIVDDFAWNPPLPVDWFAPPSEVQQVDSLEQVVPEVTTANIVDALGRFRERTGGYYPGHPRAASLLTLLMFQLRREAGAPEQDVALLEDLLAAGVFLVEQIRRGAEPTYHGGRVTAEDADAPLLIWRPAPGRQRVIFGDLRVETLQHPNEFLP